MIWGEQIDYSIDLGGFYIYAWQVALVVGVLISVAVALTEKKRDWKPRPRWLYLTLSIATSVVWLDFLCNIMVDMLTFIQILTGLSDLFMGLTILGIGNSTVDLFVDCELSKQGLEILALSGLIGGQMFNFLIGFGFASLKNYIFGNEDQKNFNLFDLTTIISDSNNLALFIVLASSKFILVLLIFTFYFNK